MDELSRPFVFLVSQVCAAWSRASACAMRLGRAEERPASGWAASGVDYGSSVLGTPVCWPCIAAIAHEGSKE